MAHLGSGDRRPSAEIENEPPQDGARDPAAASQSSPSAEAAERRPNTLAESLSLDVAAINAAAAANPLIGPGLITHLPWNGTSWASTNLVLVLSVTNHIDDGGRGFDRYARFLPLTSFEGGRSIAEEVAAAGWGEDERERFLVGHVLIDDGETAVHNLNMGLKLEGGRLERTTYVDARKGRVTRVSCEELKRLRARGAFLTPRVRKMDMEIFVHAFDRGMYDGRVRLGTGIR